MTAARRFLRYFACALLAPLYPLSARLGRRKLRQMDEAIDEVRAARDRPMDADTRRLFDETMGQLEEIRAEAGRAQREVERLLDGAPPGTWPALGLCALVLGFLLYWASGRHLPLWAAPPAGYVGLAAAFGALCASDKRGEP